MSSRALAIAALVLTACAPVEMGGTPAAAPDHPHHHGEPLVHRFQSAEQWAKEFDDPARDAWQKPDHVIAALKITPGMTVADLGAGTGYFLPHLSRAVGDKGKVIALDIEPDMVRFMLDRAAREHLGNVEARVVPLDDPGLPAGSVDRVLIVDTWHHIDGRPAYAAKLRAALAPGGAVVVVDFKKDARRGPPPEHRLDAAAVVAELGQAGLAAEAIDVDLPEQYVVVGRRR